MTTFWKERNFSFNTCSLCIMTICCSNYFPIWFRERYLGSDCIIPGHCLPFTLHSNVLEMSPYVMVRQYMMTIIILYWYASYMCLVEQPDDKGSGLFSPDLAWRNLRKIFTQ